MEEATTSDLVRENSIEMDEILTAVMPDSWLGHARLKIRKSADLSEEAEAFALELCERVVPEKDAPAEKIAAVAIDKAQEKYE